jgi:hypothetical protein
MRPYGPVSHWKQAATNVLLDSVPGAKRADVMRYIHNVVLLALNHTRGKGMGSTNQVESYALRIKSARKAWV